MAGHIEDCGFFPCNKKSKCMCFYSVSVVHKGPANICVNYNQSVGRLICGTAWSNSYVCVCVCLYECIAGAPTRPDEVVRWRRHTKSICDEWGAEVVHLVVEKYPCWSWHDFGSQTARNNSRVDNLVMRSMIKTGKLWSIWETYRWLMVLVAATALPSSATTEMCDVPWFSGR